jgi:hypothetical protein
MLEYVSIQDTPHDSSFEVSHESKTLTYSSGEQAKEKVWRSQFGESCIRDVLLQNVRVGL